MAPCYVSNWGQITAVVIIVQTRKRCRTSCTHLSQTASRTPIFISLIICCQHAVSALWSSFTAVVSCSPYLGVLSCMFIFINMFSFDWFLVIITMCSICQPSEAPTQIPLYTLEDSGCLKDRGEYREKGACCMWWGTWGHCTMFCPVKGLPRDFCA